jgi:cytochrome c
MKKQGLLLATLAVALSSTPALAADEMALATKSACTACHAVDKKLVGPAYKDVAAKYKGNAKAQAMLEEKVKKGGVGDGDGGAGGCGRRRGGGLLRLFLLAAGGQPEGERDGEAQLVGAFH